MEDERVVRCLGEMELCMETRMKLLKRMRMGYFRLGKARLEGRFGQISTNRLPSDLRASTKIRVTESGKFEIVKGSSSSEFENDDESAVSKQVSKSGLRRRRGGKEKKSKEYPLEKSSKDVDIINWFGLCAPESLRKAQKEFIKSLRIAIEIANINREIERELEAIVSLDLENEIQETSDSKEENSKSEQ